MIKEKFTCINVPACAIPCNKRSVANAGYTSLSAGNKAQIPPLTANRRQVITKVARRPIKSAIVPKMKLPISIPAMYRLWAKDFFHWSSQTIPRSKVAVDWIIDWSPDHPWSQDSFCEVENCDEEHVSSLLKFKYLKKAY